MITAETTDAQSFAQTLKLLTELMPTMHEPARRRAALKVAHGRATLEAAVAAEGYKLDAPPAPAKPPSAATIAELRHAQAVLQDSHATPRVIAVVRNLANEKIHAAAKELMAKNPKLSYEVAVIEVTK